MAALSAVGRAVAGVAVARLQPSSNLSTSSDRRRSLCSSFRGLALRERKFHGIAAGTRALTQEAERSYGRRRFFRPRAMAEAVAEEEATEEATVVDADAEVKPEEKTKRPPYMRPSSTLYAIIDTGGHQLWVEPGRFYHDTFLPKAEPNTKIVLNRVLLVRSPEGVEIGRPWVKEASVNGRILHVFKDTKLQVFKFKPKKHYKRMQGHRQRQTRFVVDSIVVDGKEYTAP